MKILAILLVLLAAPMFAQAPSTAVFSWGYTYNAAYSVPCSTSVTTNCVQNFVLSQGGAIIATIPASTASSYSYNLTTLPAPGTYTYSLVAVGAYQGGTIQSAPLTVSLQYPSSVPAPSGLSVVLH